MEGTILRCSYLLSFVVGPLLHAQKLWGGWGVVGGLEQFSVSPRPLCFGFGAKGLGPGLDNKIKYFIKLPGSIDIRPAHSRIGHLTCKYFTISTISACISLQVLQLEAPAYVKYGQPIVLKCDFDLAGKTLYRYLQKKHNSLLICE